MYKVSLGRRTDLVLTDGKIFYRREDPETGGVYAVQGIVADDTVTFRHRGFIVVIYSVPQVSALFGFDIRGLVKWVTN